MITAITEINFSQNNSFYGTYNVLGRMKAESIITNNVRENWFYYVWREMVRSIKEEDERAFLAVSINENKNIW